MYKSFLFIAIAIIFAGCKTKSKSNRVDSLEMETIELSQSVEISTNDLIDKFELIPLSTPNGLMVGSIDDLIVTKDRIIISDVRVEDYAMLFDRSGKYISTLGRQGRAPNEYIDLSHVALMPDNETIALYDNYGSKILFFDHDGHFIESKLMKFRFNSMEFISDTEVVCAMYGLGEEDPGLKDSQFANDLILFTDGDFQIEGGFMPNRFQSNYTWITPYLKKIKDIVYISRPYCDTIYTVSPTMELKAGYRIDMSEIGGAVNFDSNITDEQVGMMREQNAIFNGDFLETDEFAKINISHPPQGKIKSYIYDKNNDMVYLVNPEYNEDIYFASANIAVVNAVTDDNKLAVAVPAYQIVMITSKHVLDKYDELKGLTEDSNPVLILYTLKMPTDAYEK